MENIYELHQPVDLPSIFNNWQPYDKFIKAEAENYEYVVFFGCGLFFSNLIDTWYAQVKTKIHYCCDNNPEKWGKVYSGVECISIEKLLEIKKNHKR